ncbi:MAG: MarR family transcriptional regulator [Chloroflexota bacterium]
MDDLQSERAQLVGQVIEAFWRAVPPAWHSIRAYTHNTAVEHYQMTMAQFAILRGIYRGKTTVSELAEAGRTSRPATSRMVDLLVNKGLVQRVEDREDRRRAQLSLTEQGKLLLEAIFEQTRAWMQVRLERLDDEALAAMLPALEGLQTAFGE